MLSSEPLSMELEAKRRVLDANLRSAGRLMVAYSGGTDSAYLALAAYRALGSDMLAVIADSPSLSRMHLRDALDFAEEQGIPIRVIDTRELESADYARNDSSRCFHCKDELFNMMAETGRPLGFSSVAYGMNMDDRGDFRPGQKAAVRHQVLAPLVDAGLTKEEIRTLARHEGLRVLDKPASACLSSRIAYGLPVTRETLERIEKAEEVLFARGFRQFRVRHHGDLARIEIVRSEMPEILSLQVLEQISSEFKRLGYKYVTLDLEGYRSGSMNDLLPVSQLAQIEQHSQNHSNKTRGAR